MTENTENNQANHQTTCDIFLRRGCWYLFSSFWCISYVFRFPAVVFLEYGPADIRILMRIFAFGPLAGLMPAIRMAEDKQRETK